MQEGWDLMASLRKRGRYWYVRFRTPEGRSTELKAGPDKSVAQQISRDIESKNARIKAGTLDPREAAYNDAERVHIITHVQDYVRHIEASGCVPDHVNPDYSRRVQRRAPD